MKSITFTKVYTVLGCVLLLSLMSIQVSAQANFALGTSTASGPNAFAAGDNSLAQGIASIAAGNMAQALGDYSISLGDNTYADQKGAVAFGAYSYSQSEHALAFGLNNWIQPNAYYSLAIGAGNQVSAWGGVAIGRDNFAHGASSIAMGTWNTANSYGEIVLGAYSDTTGQRVAPHAYAWDENDKLLSIGNGFGDGAGNGTYSNALTMLKNGDTDMVGNLDIAKRIKIGDDPNTTPEPGDIRYNFASNDFEGFKNGIGWTSFTLGGGGASSRGIGEFSKDRLFSWDMASSTPPIAGELDEDVIGITCVNIEDQNVPGSTYPSSGGIGLGNQASQGRMTITKSLDLSTTELLNALHNGTVIDKATIAVEHPAGGTTSGIAEVDYSYLLKRIKVVDYSFDASDGSGAPIEEVVIEFDCYELTNTVFDTNGNADGAATTKWNYTTKTTNCPN